MGLIYGANYGAHYEMEDAVAKTKKILSSNAEASVGVECLYED
jgi:molecular chaperone DnaK (HSP70)